MYLNHLALILIVTSFVDCEFESDILKVCYEDECGFTDSNRERFESVEYKRSLYDFVTTSPAKIFWDNLNRIRTNSVHGQQLNISSSCLRSLNLVLEGLDKGDDWAFQFLDSSGKTPAGLMSNTMTSLGDYDQCLDISSSMVPGHKFEGQYCSLDMFPLIRTDYAIKRQSHNYSSKFSLDQVPGFKGLPLSTAICIPSNCHANEVQQLMRTFMEPYLLSVTGFINCDTKSSTSYITRLVNLTNYQIISAIFVITIILIVITSTVIDLLSRFMQTNYNGDSLISQISLVTSSLELFVDKSKGTEPWSKLVIDIAKFVIIIAGTNAHLVACVETPNSWLMMDRLNFVRRTLSDFAKQFAVNDGGLGTIIAISGYVTFAAAFPLAKVGRLPYKFAVLDRYLRFLPSVLAITCLEFLWPIWGSGPLYTRVGDFVLKKCSKNFWINFTFLNNWMPSIDTCAGHLYFTATDLQVFVLGLIAIYLFAKKSRSGLKFSFGIILIANVWLLINIIRVDASISLLMADSTYEQFMNYLDYIHMHITPYLIAYFYGILGGYLLETGFTLSTSTWRQHLLIILIANLLYATGLSLIGLKRVFELFPNWTVPIIILINRNIIPIYTILLIVYVKSIPNLNRICEPYKDLCGCCRNVSVKKVHYSFVKGMCRLGIAIYFSNYLYIRTEFFTSRDLFPGLWIPIFKRIIYMFVIIFVVAFAFHVFVIAPFDSVRKFFYDKLSKFKCNSKTSKDD